MSRQTWIILGIGVAGTAFNFWRILRTPRGPEMLRVFRRELLELNAVRTWILWLASVVSILFLALMGGFLVTAPRDWGAWLFFVTIGAAEIVIVRATVRRRRHQGSR